MAWTRHVEFDCATGGEVWRDSTPEEHQALADRQAAYNAAVEADRARQAQDVALVTQEAAADPAFAALARLAGIRLPATGGAP